MTLSLNKPKLDNLADEIWKSAERLAARAPRQIDVGDLRDGGTAALGIEHAHE